MIPVTQKASNTCMYCRIRKQRCDRELPSCSRCAVKLRPCDYTWIKHVPRFTELEVADIGPLFVQRGTCGSDLSPRGREELLQATTACTNREPGSTGALLDLVYDILEQANTTVSAILEEHAFSIHQWCPLISEEMLRNGRDGAFDKSQPDWLPSPLVVLSIFLLTRYTCCHSEHIITGLLYTTVKQLLTLLRAAGEVCLELFRAEMLVAVYECGHGMAEQAYVTLSSCVALFALIQLDMRGTHKESCSEEVMTSLRAAIVVLDRMIPLSILPRSLPLATPTKYPLSQSVFGGLEPCIPPPTPTPYASSPRKVHIRAMVALGSGRVLEHIHALHYGFHPDETYEEVDAAVSLAIKKLVDKPQPHTWLHCDAIAMVFCSNLLLQQAQVQNMKVKHTDPSLLEATKAMLALHYSRRMAWDMVRVMVQKIHSEEELSQLPFAGMCCVIRAAVAVFETKECGEEFNGSNGELQEFKKILGWFAARWNIGAEYVKRVEQCLGDS